MTVLGAPPSPGSIISSSVFGFGGTVTASNPSLPMMVHRPHRQMTKRSHYVLFFIDIASRSVHIGGITPDPDNSWMTQVARNVTDIRDGFLRGKRYLLLDRDTKYSDAFRGIITRAGIEVVRLPPRSANLNAFAERFVAPSGRMSGSDDLCGKSVAAACGETVSVALPW
jgi:transposase InsO family protein